MADPWKCAFIVVLVLLLAGCSGGGGCQNESQCKPGETCKNGKCEKGCIREYEWCEKNDDCCSGMECKSNACRSKNQGTGTTPGQNKNLTGNTTNASSRYVPFDLRVFDLAEGQQSSVGELLIKVSDVSATLDGCTVENESVKLLVQSRNKTQEFSLLAGESVNVGNANIKVLNIPCTVSENETSCTISGESAKFEIVRTDVKEAVLGENERFMLPDGLSMVEATDVEHPGELPEYWRSVELAQGESVTMLYPTAKGIAELKLTVDEISETWNPVPEGRECSKASKQVKMRAKITGMTEFYVTTREKETSDARVHRIKVESVSEQTYPSDGSGCVAYNKKALLNISFPGADSDLIVQMSLYGPENVSSIVTEPSNPWNSSALRLEVSPVGESGAGGDQFHLMAVGNERGFGRITAGGNLSFRDVSLTLESFVPRFVEVDGRCVLVDFDTKVAINDGKSISRKEVNLGDAVRISDDIHAKFLDASFEISRNVGSCRIALKRAVIAVTPLLNKTR